jgi:CRP-like cAMP-binding protein
LEVAVALASLARNLLLSDLPADDTRRLLPKFDVIPMKLRQMLQTAREPVTHVYFPGGGFISVVTPLADGTMVEVATVGREGFSSVEALLKSDAPAHAGTMVQGEAELCYRLRLEDFEAEVGRQGAFAAQIRRYSYIIVAMAMQSTACNAAHQVEQRLARWLLMAHDRMQVDSFALTQEFAAMMLGTSRPTVTLIAGALQSAGLIDYRRGHLTIRNREGLEDASCECYGTMAALLTRAQ